jgi:diacylglycerol kinase (ATP)
MRRAYLVYNPAAGRFPSRLLSERAAELLRNHGWQIHLERSEGGGHITELARQAAASEMDAFLVVGGDGSMNQALAGLMDTPTALGVLPAGTANVWAQELGLPGLSWTRWMALEESAHRLADAPVRRVDVGMCNDQPFLLWAGIGLDAFVVHRVEPRRRWEKHFAFVHYGASVVWNASFWHGMNLQVEVQGKSVSGHFLLAVVSNIHLYAGGLAQLSPDARLDDGYFDLWLLKGETLADTAQRAFDLFSGHHLQSDQCIYIPFQSAHMESDSPMYVQVDGEPVETQDGVNIQVRPKALRVLVPEQTPHTLFGTISPAGQDQIDL